MSHEEPQKNGWINICLCTCKQKLHDCVGYSLYMTMASFFPADSFTRTNDLHGTGTSGYL